MVAVSVSDVWKVILLDWGILYMGMEGRFTYEITQANLKLLLNHSYTFLLF